MINKLPHWGGWFGGGDQWGVRLAASPIPSVPANENVSPASNGMIGSDGRRYTYEINANEYALYANKAPISGGSIADLRKAIAIYLQRKDPAEAGRAPPEGKIPDAAPQQLVLELRRKMAQQQTPRITW